MTEGCGDQLPGLYGGITLVCELQAGHHGRHIDGRFGPTVEWNDNAYRLLEATA